MIPSILLTFDVEDWFQVENFKPYIPFSTWPNRELRVEQNTHKLLDLLDQNSSQRSAISDQPINGNGQRTTDNGQDKKVQGTFFVLGWIAECLPHLVREIHSRGHEIASHGYSHELCNKCSQADLEEDLVRSKKLLEDITGAPVYGYRAPSFSIDDDILKFIQDCGYLYDSSFNSFSMHGRYGHLNMSGNNARGIAIPVNQKSAIENRQFFELPISNLNFKKPFSYTCPVKFFRKDGKADLTGELSAISSEQSKASFVLPWGGGAYFRFMPYPLFRWGVQSILKKQNGYVFYMHPWEVDPTQPRVNQASLFFKFRHYTNLSKTASKLSSFIQAFKDCNFTTCYQYLKKMPRGKHKTPGHGH